MRNNMDNLIKVLTKLQKDYGISDDEMTEVGKAIGVAINEAKTMDVNEITNKYDNEVEDGEEETEDNEFEYTK